MGRTLREGRRHLQELRSDEGVPGRRQPLCGDFRIDFGAEEESCQEGRMTFEARNSRCVGRKECQFEPAN
jgi:hypothetical protein